MTGTGQHNLIHKSYIYFYTKALNNHPLPCIFTIVCVFFFNFSTKSEKTTTSNSSNTLQSPVSSSGGVIQMLPLKLADKKVSFQSLWLMVSESECCTHYITTHTVTNRSLNCNFQNNQNITPNHTRTGSSPAVIQQLNPTHTGNPAMR